MSEPMPERVRLADIGERIEKATEGPWAADGSLLYAQGGVNRVTPRGRVGQAWGLRWREDLEFIAHARTDVPAMHAALTAVLALHVPNEHCFHEHEGAPCCQDCEQVMPCSTRRAIEPFIEIGGE